MDSGLLLFRILTSGATPRMREFPFRRRLDWAAYARVRKGFIPRSRADKWLVLYNYAELSLHRSGNGVLVYRVRFANTGGAFDAQAARINTEFEPLAPLADDYESRFLGYLIDRLLLGRDTPFPPPPGATPEAARLAESIWMGHVSTCTQPAVM